MVQAYKISHPQLKFFISYRHKNGELHTDFCASFHSLQIKTVTKFTYIGKI
jgi:hypothetical protein